MQLTIDETNRRRSKQIEFNKKHNITPKQIVKKQSEVLTEILPANKPKVYKPHDAESKSVAEEVFKYMSQKDLESLMKAAKKNMEQAAKELDFMNAARYRDEMLSIEN